MIAKLHDYPAWYLAAVAVLSIVAVALLARAIGGDETPPLKLGSEMIESVDGPLPAEDGEVVVRDPEGTYLHLTPAQASQAALTTPPIMSLAPVGEISRKQVRKLVPNGREYPVDGGTLLVEFTNPTGFLTTDEGQAFRVDVAEVTRWALLVSDVEVPE